MRIGLNLLHAHPAIGGGWNYIKNIVCALQELDDLNQYTVYCNDSSKSLIKKKDNFHITSVPIDGRNRVERIFWENTLLQWRAKVDKIDAMHWFANTCAIYCTTPSIVTVHDLLAYQKPESYPFIQRIYVKLMLPLALKKANIITPVSHTTLNDILNRFTVNFKKMIVIPNIVADSFVPAPISEIRKFRETYHLEKDFWLYVSHYYPHKNHDQLFEAYAILKTRYNEVWPLVLCGSKNNKDASIEKALNHYGISKDVVWLPRIEDKDMPVLYSAAKALIFPSLFEGGGIPVMEAMACGCPVAASDLPTTREFAGNAAICFNPENTNSILKAMEKFHANKEVTSKYKLLGLEKANDFRKTRIISKLLKTYELAIQRI